MPKLTKAAARRRLLEAENKFKIVYMNFDGSRTARAVVKTADMDAISKIVKRCIDRIN